MATKTITLGVVTNNVDEFGRVQGLTVVSY